MSKRLQVLLSDSEMDEIQNLAELERVTTGEWVRRALREVRLRRSGADPQVRLKAVRLAAEFLFPTGDIHLMLAEIELGYNG